MKRIISLILTFLLSLLSISCQNQDSSWTPNIIYEEIDIEGINNEYHFLFLTDTHMIVMNDEDTKQMQDNAIPRLAEFQNAEGVSSAEQFHKWIEYANDQKLDGVLFGGDIIDYPSDANISHFKSNLDKLEVPYLYTLGNHDWTYPWDYMSETGKATYIPLLSEFTTSNPAIHTMEFKEFIIVALDNSTTQFDASILDEFKNILKKDKPTIVMFHVPVMTQSVLGRAKEIRGKDKRIVLGAGNYGGIYPNEISQEIMNLLVSEKSPVELVLAGHVHFYDKDYVEGIEPVIQIVGDAGYKGSAIHLTIK